MPDRRTILAYAGVGIVAGLAGWALSSRSSLPAAATQALRSTRFADLKGNARSLSEWDGRVRVVNFWATWCAPCREEIPALVLSRESLLTSGVEFIGIAIDQAAKVAEFVRSIGISYPVLVAGAEALDLVRNLGNPAGGLPFTVVLDQKGGVAYRNLGVVTRETIEKQVRNTLNA